MRILGQDSLDPVLRLTYSRHVYHDAILLFRSLEAQLQWRSEAYRVQVDRSILRGVTKPPSCSSHLSAIFSSNPSHPSTPSHLAAPSSPSLSTCVKRTSHLVLQRPMGRNHVILFPLVFAICRHLVATLSLPPAILRSHLPPCGHLSSFDLGENMGTCIFPHWVPPLKSILLSTHLLCTSGSRSASID